MQLAPNGGDLTALFTRIMAALLAETPAPRTLAIALSGGADSRALTLLAKDWANANGAALHAIIIDHGLRDESTKEAQQTADWAHSIGLPAQIIPLALTRGEAAIQQRARDARYAAMTAACQQMNAAHLLLGQHADDQIETTLFRLLRGSGLHGLAGMSAKRSQQDITLLRPLLSVRKEALKTYLTQRGHDWIEDPSNQNEQFARTQMRNWLTANASETQQQRLWHFANHCGRIRCQDEAFLNKRISALAQMHDGAMAEVSMALFDEPSEIAIWILRRLVISIHGNMTMPRQHEVERLYEDLRNEPNKARSLHHCLIFKHKNGLIICREPARVAEPLTLQAHTHYRWDSRWSVRTGALPKGCQLAPLGEAGYQALKKQISLPRRAALSLPTLMHLEALVYVPHIDYCASTKYKDAIQLTFKPAKALAEAPFFLMNGAKT